MNTLDKPKSLYVQEGSQRNKTKRLITVLCTANECRSPLTHALLLDAIEKLGIGEYIDIESAGTDTPEEENKIDFGKDITLYSKIKAMKEGVLSKIPQRKSQKVTENILYESDLIFVMTEKNRERLKIGFPNIFNKVENKIDIFGDGKGIEDPYSLEGTKLAEFTKAQYIKGYNPFETMSEEERTYYNKCIKKYDSMGNDLKKQIGRTLEKIIQYLLSENIIKEFDFSKINKLYQ